MSGATAVLGQPKLTCRLVIGCRSKRADLARKAEEAQVIRTGNAEATRAEAYHYIITNVAGNQTLSLDVLLRITLTLPSIGFRMPGKVDLV